MTARNPKLLGAVFHVWCDQPSVQTEDQVAKGIMNPLRGMAQNTWGASKPVPTYQGFTSIINSIGRAPGYIPPRGPVPE